MRRKPCQKTLPFQFAYKNERVIFPNRFVACHGKENGGVHFLANPSS